MSLVDDNNKYEKVKDVNKKFVTTINDKVYKDVLLNKKCLRHSMNRIQRKDQKLTKSTRFFVLL